jgi:hypothetical protein
MVAPLPSVFLSYARGDDEPFVRRLHGALKAAGFQVWWDRESMPGRALTFQQEIRDAIDAHDRTLLIVGPRAVQSDYVRAEWQYALAADKVVSPVLRLGEGKIIPAELRSLHYVNARQNRDEGAAFAEIVRIATDPPPPVGRPFHVPTPPPHFQPRIEAFSKLASLFVMKEPSRLALPASRRSVVVQGMTGLGKSVLAASLARATATRRLFPHGVVWLGFTAEEKSPLERLQTLGSALGDDIRAYDSEEGAAASIGRLLEKQAVLLVLDNVWFDEQVLPFRQALGRRCQMLVTTRDASLAGRLGAELHALDLLSLPESRRLLADWVDEAPEALPEDANAVIEECGRLPFALALAGAMAAGGTAWPDLLAALKEADLAFVKAKFPDYEYTDLLRAQQAGLEALLRSEDAEHRRAAERYLAISALRWERAVPEAALVTLWLACGARNEREARETLTTLAGKALVRVDGHSPDRRVFLHDLQQDFLRFRVPERAAAHRSILEAYNKRYPLGPLAATDDGYYFDSLFHHLGEAGPADEMHALLRREDGSGRNAWWAKRIDRGQAFGYEADVRRAWADAAGRAVSESGDIDPAAVAQSARYALMIGSFRDALSGVPLALVQSLLANGVWTTEHALAAARWQQGHASRAEGLAAVLPKLEGQARDDVADDALAIIRTFPEAGDEARYLLKVARGIDGERRRRLLEEVVALARQDLAGGRIEYLKEAWTLQPETQEWLQEAVAVMAESADFGARSRIAAMAEVAPDACLPRLVRLARGLPEEEDRAFALLALAPRLQAAERGAVAAEACGLARGARSPATVSLLARAARWLDGEKRRTIVDEVLNGLAALDRAEHKQLALATALPVLEGRHRTAAEKALWQGVAELRSASTAAELLTEFATPGGLAEAAPAVVKALVEPLAEAVRRDEGGRYSRADALSRLAAMVDAKSRRKLLEEEERRAQLIDDQSERVQCLTALAGRLDAGVREPVVGRLLDLPVVRAAGIGISPRSLAPLMRMATGAQLERAAKTLPETREASDFAVALAMGFAQHRLWDEVFPMLNRTRGAYHLKLILAEFPDDVPAHVASSIVRTAVDTGDPELCAAAIPPLVRHLEPEDRETSLEIAMQVLDALDHRRARTELAHDILPELPCDTVEDVRLRLKDNPKDFDERPHEMRARLASRLFQCGRPAEALDALKGMTYDEDRAAAVAGLAAFDSPLKRQFAEWAELLLENAWPDNAVAVLVRLAASCADEPERKRLLAKAATLADTVAVDDHGKGGGLIDPRETKARALLHVAPSLDGDRRRDMLLEAWRLAPKGGAFGGVGILEELSVHLGRLPPQDLLRPWQENLTSASRHRAAVLQELAALPDVVHRLGGKEAVAAIVVAVEDVARWWPDAAR